MILRKILASVHPDFHLSYIDFFTNFQYLQPIHEYISYIRNKFACNLNREEREYLAAKDHYWWRNWMNCRTSFEIQAQSTPTNFKIYGDIAFTSTAVDNNSVPTKCDSTSTAVNNNKLNITATAANNEAPVAPVPAITTVQNCTTLPTESQPSVNPEYHHNNIKGKGKSTEQRYQQAKEYLQHLRDELDGKPSTNPKYQRNIIEGNSKTSEQRYRDLKQQLKQFKEKLDRSDKKRQILRERLQQLLRTPPAKPSVKPNNNNQLSSPSTNNTATERDMKRTEYRNTKGKGSTEYDKRKGACSNNSGVKSAINKQTTTATQQNSEVNLATKQCDQVPRVKNKENHQVPRVNNPVKLEPNVSAPRVTVNYISSIEQQQKSDNNNSSIQQQLPPILHDNKLPVIKKLDGKAGKAEKWQIACENGFGRMIPVTVPAI